MASSDARPIPIKNTAFRAVFPILDADGDLVTGATGLDSEVSKDQGAFADCTNEATEIATSSGLYYLDLTSTEMNADCVAVIVKTTSSGAKTTVLVLYPQEADDIKTSVTHWTGTAVASPDTAGYPKVTLKSGSGIGEVSLAAGVVTASVTGDLSATMKASVNTEVLDVLATDTYAEPAQGAPAATTTLAAKINYLYKAWRNKKTNDGATTKLYADDGTTVDHKQDTS